MRLAEPDPPAEADRVLTVAEAAAWLGRKESYVADLVRQRRIPAVILPGARGKRNEGKYRGILLSSLKAWTKAQEDPGTK
jgi:excisionase family DNA binding protein